MTADADTLPPLPPDPDDSIDTPPEVLDAWEASRQDPPATVPTWPLLPVGTVLWTNQYDNGVFGMIWDAKDDAERGVRPGRPARGVRLVVAEVLP